MSNREGAVAHWRRALGDERVRTDPQVLAGLLRNTSEFAPREIVAELRPGSVEQVVAAVRVAREHGVPLYPYSKGKNWGLGSKLPPRDGCALLDLGGLDQIRAVDVRRHYAVVEPGVTPRQLSEHLRANDLPLRLNVTGSSLRSSLVGNVMERGTGFHKQRTEDLRGVEAVLGTGDLVRTGFWSDEPAGREIHHYRYGIGPYLDGLFTESNLGVVTAVVLDLLPAQDETRLLMFTFDHASLPAVVDGVSRLFGNGMLRSIVHMFNDKRISTVSADPSPPMWTGVTSVQGTAAYVAFAMPELERALSGYGAACHFLSEAEATAPGADPMLAGMFRLHSGVPDDVFLHGLYNTLGEVGQVDDVDAVDESRHGMLACLPIIPMDGATVADALSLVDSVCQRYDLTPAVAVNPIDGDCLESVINVYFDRRVPEQVARAQACNRKLHETLLAEGFRFYRADIENMRLLMDDKAPFWRTVRLLKGALDPDGILAPGRYCPEGD